MRAVSASTHLRSRSSYSFGSGADTPAALVEAAAVAGYAALALTDRDGLYGAIPFYRAAEERGIRPIIGAEITLMPAPIRDPRTGIRRPAAAPEAERTVVALAESREGYASLCRLVTARHMDDPFDILAALRRAASGLILLCPHAEWLEPLAGSLPPRALYAEICAGRTAAERRAVSLEAGRLTIPLAATWDVHAATRDGLGRHRLLRAIERRTTLDRLPAPEESLRAGWLAPRAEFERPFREAPAPLAGAAEIAERCHLHLDFGAYRFPRAPLPHGRPAVEELRALCEQGLAARYGSRDAAARTRLGAELDVIGTLGFADYFLVVHDIVRRARARGIPIVGRGSAADSLVAYVLGITEADPIAHDLYFERFLNRGRTRPPDIDLDICWRRRDDVISDVVQSYGRDRVAMISTHVAYHLRSAFRDVARAHGLPEAETDALARALPPDHDGDVAHAFAAAPESADFPRETEPYRTILQEAVALAGLPRHLGIHPGGIVLAPGPLAALVPLERAANGTVVTQYDMGPVEDLGLLKLDLLGHRSLSVIADTLVALGPAAPDIEHLAPDLPEVAALLTEARTLGCFQSESPAMRNLLRMMRADTREDLTAALSMIRPGPSSVGMKEAFVRRRRGEEPVRYLHPALEPILARTYGILLYQEDVLRVAQAIGGLTLEEADDLREAITKNRSPGRMEPLAARFHEGARERGAPPGIVSRLWEIISHFAGYSFCKAHAVTYGLIAYRALYLKARHPAEFFAAVLTNEGGFYGPGDYLEEARRCGVRILLPDINASEVGYTAAGGAIRIGLMQVKGLSASATAGIPESRRRDGPFHSLADLLLRVALTRPESESLIRCGALDSLGRTRPELLVDLATRLRGRKRASRSPACPALFDLPPAEGPRLHLPDYAPAQRLAMEQEILGLRVSTHPARLARRTLDAYRPVPATELPARAGSQVWALGWLVATRRTRTRDGQPMRFLTLEDESGTFEVVFFPDAYRRLGARLGGDGPYLVRGRVESQMGAVTLRACDVAVVAGEEDTRLTAPAPGW
jgi:DNA-directed DNA polymerase III PolC